MTVSGAVPRGRFAPSPTGYLHFGNAATALLAWLQAKALGGQFLLRMEDLDAERCQQKFADAILRDLEYLGLNWDGPVLYQSTRSEAYQQHIEHLVSIGQAYSCFCSRADVARAATAPHLGEEGPVYPGTCRYTRPALGAVRRCIRFAVSPGNVKVTDLFAGTVEQDVAAQVGDFVIAKADGRASYQLAVVVDDHEQGVTHVLRGADLLSSAARQSLLRQALNCSKVSYAHVPLLCNEKGARLAKRDGADTLTALRTSGVPGERVLAMLARAYGLTNEQQVKAAELLGGFDLNVLRAVPTPVVSSIF
jgi:glutamyl-tRNA synthetase